MVGWRYVLIAESTPQKLEGQMAGRHCKDK